VEAISIRGLTKQFSYYEKEAGRGSSFRNLLHREKLVREAVKEISFAIEAGEIVGFLGPNGAGKTTTLKMLSGILYPTAGRLPCWGLFPGSAVRRSRCRFPS
jgi:ABC-2 type transport system ATP-binding protein